SLITFMLFGIMGGSISREFRDPFFFNTPYALLGFFIGWFFAETVKRYDRSIVASEFSWDIKLARKRWPFILFASCIFFLLESLFLIIPFEKSTYPVSFLVILLGTVVFTAFAGSIAGVKLDAKSRKSKDAVNVYLRSLGFSLGFAVTTFCASYLLITILVGYLYFISQNFDGSTWLILASLQGTGLVFWEILLTSISLGLLIFFILGGIDLTRLGILRVLLRTEQRIPMSLKPQLEYLSRIEFLRRVGPGYIFRHVSFQKYFAKQFDYDLPDPKEHSNYQFNTSKSRRVGLISNLFLRYIPYVILIILLIRIGPLLVSQVIGVNYFYQGQYLMKQQQVDAALTKFNQAESYYADMPAIYRNRGLVYLDAGDCNRAIPDLLRAVSNEFHNSQLHYDLGRAYDLCNNNVEAIRYFTIAIEIDPGNTRAYYNRGFEYVALNQWESAKADFDHSIENGLADQYIYLSRAFAHEQLGDIEAALDDYDKVIVEYKGLPDPYLKKGSLLVRIGQFEQAIQDLSIAINLGSSSSSVYYFRGLAFNRLELNDEAFKDYNTAIEKDPTRGLYYYQRGALFKELERYDEAIKDLENALFYNENQRKVHLELVSAYRLAKQYSKAIEIVNQSIADDPLDTHFILQKGLIFRDQGHFDLALEQLNIYVELEKSSRAYYERGLIYAMKGLYQAAISDYTNAYDKDKTNPYLTFHFGTVYYVMEDYSMAEKYLLDVFQLTSDQALIERTEELLDDIDQRLVRDSQ
ncbi:MAG: tetratricopeptide repeat protein, partial [Chloroflexota bacterium]